MTEQSKTHYAIRKTSDGRELYAFWQDLEQQKLVWLSKKEFKDLFDSKDPKLPIAVATFNEFELEQLARQYDDLYTLQELEPEKEPVTQGNSNPFKNIFNRSKKDSSSRTSSSRRQVLKTKRPMDDDEPKPKTKAAPLSFIRFFIYFVAGVMAGFLLYRSFGLFQITFDKFGIGVIRNTCTVFGFIPFMGGGIARGCLGLADFINGTIAFLTLIALSILQLIPTLMYFHPGSIRGMVGQLRANSRASEKLDFQEGDSKEVRRMVVRHNRMNDRALTTFLIFSVGAFAMEAAIVWVARSGRADLMSVLADSLALDLLAVATLAFANAFAAKASTRQARSYS